MSMMMDHVDEMIVNGLRKFAVSVYENCEGEIKLNIVSALDWRDALIGVFGEDERQILSEIDSLEEAVMYYAESGEMIIAVKEIV